MRSLTPLSTAPKGPITIPSKQSVNKHFKVPFKVPFKENTNASSTLAVRKRSQSSIYPPTKREEPITPIDVEDLTREDCDASDTGDSRRRTNHKPKTTGNTVRMHTSDDIIEVDSNGNEIEIEASNGFNRDPDGDMCKDKDRVGTNLPQSCMCSRPSLPCLVLADRICLF